MYLTFAYYFFNIILIYLLNIIFKANYSGYYSISDESFIPEKDLIQTADGKYATKLNQPVEFISEENFSLNFTEDNSIEIYKEQLENKKIQLQPEYLKNEVAEYMNQKLFVIKNKFYFSNF